MSERIERAGWFDATMVENLLIFRGGFGAVMSPQERFGAHVHRKITGPARIRSESIRDRGFSLGNRLGRLIVLQIYKSAHQRNVRLIQKSVGREPFGEIVDEFLGAGDVADACEDVGRSRAGIGVFGLRERGSSLLA